MANSFGTITLIGVEDLIKDLKAYDQKIQSEVAHEIEASARTIIRNAKRNAPTDQGALKRQISYKKVDRLTQELISGSEYSAFVEFGTGHQVRIDHNELFEIAQSFKGSKLTKGKQGFKEAIYAWAKRKGIDKNLWYPIFWSIVRHGTRAHPFFFGPYFNEIPLLRKRLENILNKTEG